MTGDGTRRTHGKQGEAAKPVPARYWWLRRIAVVSGMVVAALIGLRWWWGWDVHGRLEAQLDEYRRAGQPVDIDDFNSPPIPDDRNAALAIMNAAAAWIVDTDEAKAMALLREARSMPGVDWGVRFRAPGIRVALPPVGLQRQLALGLAGAARSQHQVDNDAAAVEMLRGILLLPAIVDGAPHVLVTHLVAVAIDAMGVAAIKGITPDLAVGEAAGAGAQGPAPASRTQVEALIADLLDETGLRDGLAGAMHGERGVQLDTAQAVINGQMGLSTLVAGGAKPSLAERAVVFLLRPVFELDTLKMVRHSSALVDAAGQPNWPAAKQKIPNPDFDAIRGSRAGWLTRPLSRMLLPQLSMAYVQHFHALAQRRMAAIALAMRLYELDHGRRPETLEDLVPDYLPTLPPDPFATDGRPIRYRIDGASEFVIITSYGRNGKPALGRHVASAPRPLLYSVGYDGVNDAGTAATASSGVPDRMAGDVLFFLDGKRPTVWPVPGSTTAPASRPASREAR